MSNITPEIEPPARQHLSGHVTYIFAFDIAYEMKREPVVSLMGQPVSQFQIDSNKRAPRQPFFYRPQVLKLPPVDRPCPRGTVQIERQVKIFPLGAISITIRVPFEVTSIGELVDFHDLKYTTGSNLHEEAAQLAEQMRRELAPYLIRPVETLAPEEAYTVFCITSPLESPDGPRVAAEDWLNAHRRQVAALLTEERDMKHLSDQESAESTSRYLSYYDHDMVVVDWDAALVVEDSRYVEDVIYLMELANLQLAELEWYDRLLDGVVDKAYRDLTSSANRRVGKWSGPTTLKQLRELRIDLARLSDELSNITKFFGDWHLARIYQALASRFHLADWHKTTDEKLKTLDNLYQLLQADRNNRYMLILEITIVLLFMVDVLMLFRGMMR